MPTILVLGARHLGGAILDRFSAHGYELASVCRTEETSAAVRQRHPQICAYSLDASDPDALRRIVEEVEDKKGPLDLAVNAAQPVSPLDVKGGPLVDAGPAALEPYTRTLLPLVHSFFHVCGRAMAERGRGTLIQVTGGSAARATPGKGPWAAAAFATRGLTQAAALELRERGVHVSLLVVDAVIASDKTQEVLEGRDDEESARHEDVLGAIEYLHAQSPRGWTHELRITPRKDRYVP